MRNFTFLLLCGLAAGCGTSPDERPVTFEFVTLGILAPSCGQVQCHSTTTNINGYAFDTLEASRKALLRLTGRNSADSELIDVMTASGGRRMPPDSPMNEEDLTLIKQWLDDGKAGL